MKLRFRRAPLVVQSILVWITAFFLGCATNPPPPPPNNPADPQLRGSSRTPRNLLTQDETTLAIERQLAATQAYAASAEKMEHDMGNMPGMQHGGMQHMPAMQHGQMQPHEVQSQSVESQKKALSEGMKRTSEEMKATEDEMKKKSDMMKTGATIYTCPMHPEVQSDKPGNCPKCGMKLVPKKEKAHEDH